MPVRVALLQLNSRDDKAANIAEAEAAIIHAAEAGARLVVLGWRRATAPTPSRFLAG